MTSLIGDPGHPDQWLVPAAYLNGQIVHNPTVLRGVHLREDCTQRVCLIHKPTRHHMREWPLIWDDVRKVFQRLCPHAHLHPDPDGWGTRDHLRGCDGCCHL